MKNKARVASVALCLIILTLVPGFAQPAADAKEPDDGFELNGFKVVFFFEQEVEQKGENSLFNQTCKAIIEGIDKKTTGCGAEVQLILTYADPRSISIKSLIQHKPAGLKPWDVLPQRIERTLSFTDLNREKMVATMAGFISHELTRCRE